MGAELQISSDYSNTWSDLFDRLTQMFSSGDYQQELMDAREIFFEKIGESHQIKEAFYETVSLAFLEWYLFENQLKNHKKSPAVVAYSLKLLGADELEVLRRALFQIWSIFSVESFDQKQIRLKDLLFCQTRVINREVNASWIRSWNVKKAQLIQGRLFPVGENEEYLLTHFWLHPESENNRLTKLCKQMSLKWKRHENFLLHAMECAIRTLNLQEQLSVSKRENWMYRDLETQYAETN